MSHETWLPWTLSSKHNAIHHQQDNQQDQRLPFGWLYAKGQEKKLFFFP